MLNELKLQVFCSLAETLNFTDTARKVFVSQQTVSRLISELEEEIGFSLLERSSRKVSLTEAGERYYKVVADMLWTYKRAMVDIKKDFGFNQHLLIDVQLNLDIGLGAQIAMDQLRKQHAAFDSASLRISPNQIFSRLATHKCDIAIVLDRFYEPSDQFHTQTLFYSNYLLLVSPKLFPNGFRDCDRLFLLPLLFDSLESESPTSCEQRCHRELEYLDLHPTNILWMPNADSAYARGEICDGTVIASSSDRVGFGRRLVGFPIGKTCKIIAVWRADNTNPLVKPYVQFMVDAYEAFNKSFEPATEPLLFYHPTPDPPLFAAL